MEEKELQNKIDETSEELEKQKPSELPEATAVELQLEELQKQVEMYKDLFLRKAAEFENYKRRMENEISNVVKYAAETLIEDLLPIIDDFERSLKHSKNNIDYENFVKGIELIYQKFMKVLEKRGVKTFETVGKEFNVDYHDALMQQPRSDVPPNTVIEEVEKGYMIGDKVIRHAKVIVSTDANLEMKTSDEKEKSANGELENK